MTPRTGSLLTPVGWGTALVGLLLTAAGLALGWVEAAAGGGCALVAVLIALVSTRGRLPQEVALDLADHRVQVGDRAFGAVRVTAPAGRRTRPLSLELQVGRGRAELDVPGLAAGAVHEDLFAVPTGRRAVITVGPVRAMRGDPLGLALRYAVTTGSEELFVHPRVVRLTGTDAGLLRDLEGGSTRDLSDTDLAFHALRDYVVGDDRRAIHWRTTARRGVLTVKQYQDTRRTQTTVALSTDPRDYATDQDDLELAVSVAASVGVHVLADEHPLAVLAGPARVRSTTRRALLDDCSALETTPDGASTGTLGRQIARHTPGVTLAVLVTGAGPSLTDLRAAARHVPHGTRTLAVRCEPGTDVQVRTQGALSLVRIGMLDDLPRALRLADAG